jgi:3-methyladenine DNA glycosylase Tag
MQTSFQAIYESAIARKGEEGLAALLPLPKSKTEMQETPDSTFLEEMTRCVFRSGFAWKTVDDKWPNFRKVFAEFNPKVVANFSDERLEIIAQDPSIIRYYAKVLVTRENATFVMGIAREHESFGKFIAGWPEDDLIGLLLFLKRAGSRLGGHTGQYFLRLVGRDTFIFSSEVVRVLIAQGVIDKEPTSKSGLKRVQDAFNGWREETGLPYCQLSRIMAASVSD